MQIGAQPWHLWGGTQSLRFVPPNAGPSEIGLQQLANIDYHRPDTWTFFFAIQVQSEVGSVFGGGSTFGYDLSLGVGRSNFRIPRFWQCFFSQAELQSNRVITKWSTQAQAPDTYDTQVGISTIAPNVVNWVPAQTIQCQFSTQLLFAGALNVTASAYFSPVHHARPDWYQDRFSGGELHGL